MIYNLDTCIVVEFLRSNKIVTKKLLEAYDAGDTLVICSIVRYEIMRGFDKMNPSHRQVKFEQLYSETEHIIFDEKAADIAAEIYRYLCKRGQKIEDDGRFKSGGTVDALQRYDSSDVDAAI